MANDAPHPSSLFPPSPISQANASCTLSAGASLPTGIKTKTIEDQAMQDIEASNAGEGGRVSVKKEEFEEDNDKTVSIEVAEGADSESGMWTDCEEEDEEEETSTEGGSEDEDSDRAFFFPYILKFRFSTSRRLTRFANSLQALTNLLTSKPSRSSGRSGTTSTEISVNPSMISSLQPLDGPSKPYVGCWKKQRRINESR